MYDLAGKSSAAIYAIRETSRLIYDAILQQREFHVHINVGVKEDGAHDGSFKIEIVCGKTDPDTKLPDLIRNALPK